MPAVKLFIDQIITIPTGSPQRHLQQLIRNCEALPLKQQQQLIRQLSFVLYEKQENCQKQIQTLKFLKHLLLTGSFPCYLLVSVYIFPWLLSINEFYKDRNIYKRAQLLLKDAMGSSRSIAKKSVQSYKQMLQFGQEFVVFFGQNMKYHPYSKYKIKNVLWKKVKENTYGHYRDFFNEEDKNQLQRRLSEYSPLFREHLKLLNQFLSDQVEDCLTDPTQYQDISFILLGFIELAQSYCIAATIYRISNYLMPQTILTACQFINSIFSLAQIQAIETINSKCLPLVLEHLLPIDCKNNQILQTVKHNLDSQTLNRIADYYHLWHSKTKLIGLSTKVYDYSSEMVGWLKKPAKLRYQQELQEFSNKLGKMKQSNEIKRSFVIDQNREVQTFMVNLLKEMQFCINSQKRQKIAYQNVLDELTLSEHESQKMSDFSRSLLHSRNSQSGGDDPGMMVELRGPPRKKFQKADSSLSSIHPKNSKRSKFSEINLSKRQQQKISENIYYTRNQTKKPSPTLKQSDYYKTVHRLMPFHESRHKLQTSQRNIEQPSARTVYARNSNTPQKTPVSSPPQSMFLHSSQYSQKENKQKMQIQSIYLNRNHYQEQQSGDFINFDKDSIARSQKEKREVIVAEKRDEDSGVLFEDSVKLKNSMSLQFIEYGMDRHAKLPQTLKKPKFAFKQSVTNDSSCILKDINLSNLAQSNKKNAPLEIQIQAPQDEKRLEIEFKDMSPVSSPREKRTQHTKAPQKSESRKSQSIKSEQMPELVRKPRSSNQEIAQTIYLLKSFPEENNSQIKPNSLEPYAESASGSLTDSIPSNFSGLFKRKQRKQKATSLSLNRSLRKLKVVERPVQIPDFKKMRVLQNQLGKLRKQTQKYEEVLNEKQKEQKTLQVRQKQLSQQNPYFLKRENQIIKQMLKRKQSSDHLASSNISARKLAKELRESSIKYSMSLKDYNPNVLKLKLQNIRGYSKQFKKHMVVNRCFLLDNQLLEVGYSLKQKTVTLYFTLKHHCDSLDINLNQNGILYSQKIERQFERVLVGKQFKFKTEVESTKDQEKLMLSQVEVKVSYEEKMENKTEIYHLELPLTPYNIALPLDPDESESQSFCRDLVTHYVTPLYTSCQDLLKKGKDYLQNLFPQGQFDQDTNTYTIHYLWKQRNQKIRIKLKERSFRIEGVGHPLETGRDLIQTVINMLVDHSCY